MVKQPAHRKHGKTRLKRLDPTSISILHTEIHFEASKESDNDNAQIPTFRMTHSCPLPTQSHSVSCSPSPYQTLHLHILNLQRDSTDRYWTPSQISELQRRTAGTSCNNIRTHTHPRLPLPSPPVTSPQRKRDPQNENVKASYRLHQKKFRKIGCGLYLADVAILVLLLSLLERHQPLPVDGRHCAGSVRSERLQRCAI